MKNGNSLVEGGRGGGGIKKVINELMNIKKKKR